MTELGEGGAGGAGGRGAAGAAGGDGGVGDGAGRGGAGGHGAGGHGAGGHGSGGRPRWAELPEVGGGQRSAWEYAGPADRLGTLNELTPARVARAATLVRTGTRIPLSLPLGQPDPPLFGRRPHRHTVYPMSRTAYDDWLDDFFPQGGTQWDALGHLGHRLGFYGGRTGEQVQAGELGIDAAAAGIVGRGILVDVARRAAAAGRPLVPDAATEITPRDTLDTLREQGTAVEPGDIWCLRTGWTGWYKTTDEATRAQIARRSVGDGEPLSTVGVAPGRGWAELLWDCAAAAVAADNPAVEVVPVPGRESLHVDGLVLLGLMLGELFDFEALSAECARLGRWEFLFVAVPLLLPGGIGSSGNAVALL